MTTTRREIFRGGLALASSAAPQAWALAPSQAACSRLADGRLRLAWAGPAADIRLAERPDGPFATLVAQGARAEWTGPVPVSPRPYFRLTGRSGAMETAERLLPLQGGRNFRDLGGYRGAEGRMVRWGQLYRSGSMAGLTEADYAYLSRLGISVICDFRTTAERAQEPTAWKGASAPAMVSRDYEMSLSVFLGTINDEAPTPAKTRALMARLYEEMPYTHAENYRTMFGELAEGRTPLAFNCSAGKDRTGVGAGLLLTALGVSRDQVLADYALSDKVVDYEAIARRTAGAPAPAGFEGIARLPPEIRAPMMRSDPAYLEAALSAVARREGSVADYLRLRLGVGPAQVAALRGRLLKRV